MYKRQVLDQYSRDLTALAMEGELDPVVGRETEIERLLQILSRRTKNNPCLIGEPGVGKTAIVEGLAQRIVLGAVPRTMLGKRVVTLDMASMVAGSKYLSLIHIFCVLNHYIMRKQKGQERKRVKRIFCAFCTMKKCRVWFDKCAHP